MRMRLLAVVIGLLLASCSASREATAPAPPNVARYSVADLYKNSEFFGASFSADGTKILVSSNRSGIWNAYAIPTAGGDAEPLTSSTTNSIFARLVFPADERILYSSDKGGNELTHIYVRREDGSTKDLTPGAKLKANFSAGPATTSRSSSRPTSATSATSTCTRYAADGYKRTLFYRNDGRVRTGPRLARQALHCACEEPARPPTPTSGSSIGRRGPRRTSRPHRGDVSNTAADFSRRRLEALVHLRRRPRIQVAAQLRPRDRRAEGRCCEQNWDILGAEYSKAAST